MKTLQRVSLFALAIGLSFLIISFPMSNRLERDFRLDPSEYQMHIFGISDRVFVTIEERNLRIFTLTILQVPEGSLLNQNLSYSEIEAVLGPLNTSSYGGAIAPDRSGMYALLVQSNINNSLQIELVITYPSPSMEAFIPGMVLIATGSICFMYIDLTELRLKQKIT
jgi:hypothetical protein